MKKIIFIILIITSFSLTAKDFVYPKSDKIYSSPNRSPLLDFDKEKKAKKIKKDKIKIYFKKIDKEKNRIFARGKKEDFTEIDDINKYTFSGKVIKNWDDGDFDMYKVVWDKVETKDKEAEFDEIFTSKFGIAVKKGHKFEKDDKINVKGYKENMIEAIKRIEEQEDKTVKYSKLSKKNNEINKKNQNTEYKGKNNDSYDFLPTNNLQAQNTNAEVDGINSIFNEKEEIVTTSEGCPVIPDFDQEIAIVQKKQMQGQKEVAGCSNSDETFRLIRNYDQCSNYIDDDKMKVFKRYILEYKDDRINGMIKVKDCTIDEEQESEIITAQFECGYDHNFDDQVSLKKNKTIYIDESGSERIIRDCFNTKESFPHLETFEGCDDIFTDDGVVISYRTFINDEENGGDIILTDCIPKSNKMRIYDEFCEESYIHDFDSQQSFANKQYYYYKNNQRINMGSCVQSESSLNHRLETSDCEVIYDDAKKRSSPGFRTFIENDVGKIYITECQYPEQQIVSYIPTGSIWKKISTSGSVMLGTNSAKVSGVIYGSNPSNLWMSSFAGNNCSSVSYPNLNLITYKTVLPGNAQEYVNFNNQHNLLEGYDQKSGADNCSLLYNNNLFINNNIDINSSDVQLEYLMSYSSYSEGIKMRGQTNLAYVCTMNCSFNCPNLTTLYRYPTYLKYDGTEFIDESHILETKYVCGTGSLIEGKRQ
jgi:hypothetical protein